MVSQVQTTEPSEPIPDSQPELYEVCGRGNAALLLLGQRIDIPRKYGVIVLFISVFCIEQPAPGLIDMGFILRHVEAGREAVCLAEQIQRQKRPITL